MNQYKFLRHFKGQGMNAMDSLNCRILLPTDQDIKTATREFYQLFKKKYPNFVISPGAIDKPPRRWIAVMLMKGEDMGNLEPHHYAQAQALELDMETWAQQRGGSLQVPE